jgi:hypothetical protein
LPPGAGAVGGGLSLGLPVDAPEQAWLRQVPGAEERLDFEVGDEDAGPLAGEMSGGSRRDSEGRRVPGMTRSAWSATSAIWS